MAKKEIEEREEKTEETSGEIVVQDPEELRPTTLPLVVTLPEGASKAQIEYAKVLNAYAYSNPGKWKAKKNVLIARLKELKNAPDPVESNLKIVSKNALGQ